MKVFPSLISADVLDLRSVISKLDPVVDGYHIDVMDFHFVPNLTWGPQFVHALSKATSLPLHVHLMVTHPAKWLEVLELRPHDFFIFHIEACDEKQTESLIKAARAKGCKVGLALNPDTVIEKIVPFIGSVDKILVMSVTPGFSGQEFMPEVLDKVDELVALREQQSAAFVIGMDGGVNTKNISQIRKKGVDHVAAAAAIFSAHDPVKAIADLKGC